MRPGASPCFFFFNRTATHEIYTLSLHDALPIHMSRWEASGTAPPDGDLPLAVRQRLHGQVPFALPVIAIVPVVIAVVLAATLAPARAGAAALGAAGWLAARALRAPAGVFVSR